MIGKRSCKTFQALAGTMTVLLEEKWKVESTSQVADRNYPADSFTFLEPRNPSINEFYVAQKVDRWTMEQGSVGFMPQWVFDKNWSFQTKYVKQAKSRYWSRRVWFGVGTSGKNWCLNMKYVKLTLWNIGAADYLSTLMEECGGLMVVELPLGIGECEFDSRI